MCRKEDEQFGEMSKQEATRFWETGNSRMRGRMKPKNIEFSKLSAWIITVPWTRKGNMGGKGKMSLVLVKMSSRCLRDVWPEVPRSFEAVTYEYEGRLRDMEKISFLRENVYWKTCGGVVRRGWKEMRSGVEKARKNFADRTRLDVPAHHVQF